MDEFNFKNFGDTGQNSVIGLLIIPWIRVAWKKWISGDFVSYKTLKENQDKMETKLNGHLEKEAGEDIVNAQERAKLMALQEKVSTENGHLFKQNETMFEKFDNLNSKIDKIMEIMIQQKG